MPDHTVFIPHGTPTGLNEQLREVAVEPLTTHWPLALQVLVLMVPASVPVVEHVPPA